ncbi:MAG: hypothetical protein WCG21_07805 [Eubacteriales bacterium]
MKVRQGSLIFLLVFSMLICLLAFPVSAAAGDRVLLIQSELPWNSTANTDILEHIKNAGGIAGYDVRNFTDACNTAFDFSVYKVVIIADDQSQSSYDRYNAEFKIKLETYISAGGVVLFGACHGGWNGGTITTALPGGTTLIFDGENFNYISDNANPIVTAELSDNIALTDSDLEGSSCSHISFAESSLPAGANVILRAKSTNMPTLVEYPLGAGHVIASGLTWEIAYLPDFNWAYAVKAFDDLFLYGIKLANASQAAPSGLLGVVPSVYGAADGRITGTTTAMEYKLSVDLLYTPVTGIEITDLASGTYNVRYAVKPGFDVGADADVTVAAGPNANQAAPAGLLGITPQSYGGTDGKITGTTSAMEYKQVSAAGNTPAAVQGYIPVTGTEIKGLAAGTYSVRYTAKEGFDAGADDVVTVPAGPNADQAAPVGLSVAPSAAGGSTGKITGTTTAMEYKLSADLTYKAVTGTEITGLAAGIYDLRYAAKEGCNSGVLATVIVSDVLPASIAASTPAVVSAAAPAAIAATGEHDNNLISGILLLLAAGSTLSIFLRRAGKSDVR